MQSESGTAQAQEPINTSTEEADAELLRLTRELSLNETAQNATNGFAEIEDDPTHRRKKPSRRRQQQQTVSLAALLGGSASDRVPGTMAPPPTDSNHAGTGDNTTRVSEAMASSSGDARNYQSERGETARPTQTCQEFWITQHRQTHQTGTDEASTESPLCAGYGVSQMAATKGLQRMRRRWP